MADDDPRFCQRCRKAGQRWPGLAEGVLGLAWRSGWGDKGWWPAGRKYGGPVKRDEKCEGIAKNGRGRAHPRAYAAGGDEELLLYGALTGRQRTKKTRSDTPRQAPVTRRLPAGRVACFCYGASGLPD